VIIFKNTNTKEELKQILLLQQANLPQNLSSEEKQTQGFVTVNHSLDLLARMNDVVPHIVAIDKNKVIGYSLCMHPKFEKDIEILKPLFLQINTSLKKGLNYMIMGQICIEKEYRNQGIFRKLYKTMKGSILPNFSAIITQVDVNNKRSLQAHYAIGFRLLKSYQADGHQWELIIWS